MAVKMLFLIALLTFMVTSMNVSASSVVSSSNSHSLRHHPAGWPPVGWSMTGSGSSAVNDTGPTAGTWLNNPMTSSSTSARAASINIVTYTITTTLTISSSNATSASSTHPSAVGVHSGGLTKIDPTSTLASSSSDPTSAPSTRPSIVGIHSGGITNISFTSALVHSGSKQTPAVTRRPSTFEVHLSGFANTTSISVLVNSTSKPTLATTRLSSTVEVNSSHLANTTVTSSLLHSISKPTSATTRRPSVVEVHSNSAANATSTSISTTESTRKPDPEELKPLQLQGGGAPQVNRRKYVYFWAFTQANAAAVDMLDQLDAVEECSGIKKCSKAVDAIIADSARQAVSRSTITDDERSKKKCDATCLGLNSAEAGFRAALDTSMRVYKLISGMRRLVDYEQVDWTITIGKEKKAVKSIDEANDLLDQGLGLEKSFREALEETDKQGPPYDLEPLPMTAEKSKRQHVSWESSSLNSAWLDSREPQYKESWEQIKRAQADKDYRRSTNALQRMVNRFKGIFKKLFKSMKDLFRSKPKPHTSEPKARNDPFDSKPSEAEPPQKPSKGFEDPWRRGGRGSPDGLRSNLEDFYREDYGKPTWETGMDPAHEPAELVDVAQEMVDPATGQINQQNLEVAKTGSDFLSKEIGLNEATDIATGETVVAPKQALRPINLEKGKGPAPRPDGPEPKPKPNPKPKPEIQPKGQVEARWQGQVDMGDKPVMRSFEQNVKALTEMGFPRKEAFEALKASSTGNDFYEATENLLWSGVGSVSEEALASLQSVGWGVERSMRALFKSGNSVETAGNYLLDNLDGGNPESSLDALRRCAYSAAGPAKRDGAQIVETACDALYPAEQLAMLVIDGVGPVLDIFGQPIMSTVNAAGKRVMNSVRPIENAALGSANGAYEVLDHTGEVVEGAGKLVLNGARGLFSWLSPHHHKSKPKPKPKPKPGPKPAEDDDKTRTTDKPKQTSDGGHQSPKTSDKPEPHTTSKGHDQSSKTTASPEQHSTTEGGAQSSNTTEAPKASATSKGGSTMTDGSATSSAADNTSSPPALDVLSSTTINGSTTTPTNGPATSSPTVDLTPHQGSNVTNSTTVVVPPNFTASADATFAPTSNPSNLSAPNVPTPTSFHTSTTSSPKPLPSINFGPKKPPGRYPYECTHLWSADRMFSWSEAQSPPRGKPSYCFMSKPDLVLQGHNAALERSCLPNFRSQYCRDQFFFGGWRPTLEGFVKPYECTPQWIEERKFAWREGQGPPHGHPEYCFQLDQHDVDEGHRAAVEAGCVPDFRREICRDKFFFGAWYPGMELSA